MMPRPGGSPDPTAGPHGTKAHEALRDESLDLVDVLVAEHRVVERLFAELETSTGDPRHRRDVLDVVIAELTRHSAAEERYLYPTTREHLSAGEDLARHQIAEHAEAEEIIRRLRPLDATDPDFDTLAAKLMSDVRYHVQEEETELFPRLRQACSRETLLRLGNEASATVAEDGHPHG